MYTIINRMVLRGKLPDGALYLDSKAKGPKGEGGGDIITEGGDADRPMEPDGRCAVRGKLDLSLNGTKVVSTTQWDENWSKLIADSKFISMADLGKFREGNISLQDHGNAVYFRNIIIRPL
jgi:hypothetical protein